MDDRVDLSNRIAALEAVVAKLTAQLNQRDAEVAALRQQVAERDARIAELEDELARRGKNYRPKQNAPARPTGKHDRRKRRYRKHPGVFRAPPAIDKNVISHDVHLTQCLHCGSQNIQATGRVDDHLVVDIPEPKFETHCYHRHEYCCGQCGKTSQGRGDLELPGAYLGPRVRSLVCFSRAYLGISLEKTCTLLDELFGIPLSRAGALGHLAWGSKLTAPVVERLLELLKQSPVVQADETGWRIDGRNVWAWCFCNPKIAVFLIDRRRSSDVLIETLGESIPGVLVSDFYAAYNRLNCRKQRCLTHLMRELHKLREALPAEEVQSFIQPTIRLFQDAIALGKRRKELKAETFEKRRLDVKAEFISLLIDFKSRHPECQRIWKRLCRHSEELLTFLAESGVPGDNNGGERDIRSVAAARSDGGVNRSPAGAKGFARLKSVVRTCQKNGMRFIDYMLNLTRATLSHALPPLPLAAPGAASST